MALEIRPLNRDDREEVTTWHAVGTRAVQVRRPGFEPRTLDEVMSNLHNRQPGIVDRQFVGFAGETLVGTAVVWDFEGADCDKSLLGVKVDPQFRSRGHGRELADFAHAQLGPERTMLLAEIDFDGDDWTATPEGSFARSFGYAATNFTTARELPWPPDRDELNRLDPRPAGYTIATYVDGIPNELRESFGVLLMLTDVDAPSGDVEWAGEPQTPEHYQQELARILAGGAHLVETIATHDDEVVALTTCTLPANPRRPMDIGVTYVRRDHRGRRLGLAIKVALERELLRLGVAYPSLRTGNADENVWMIAVNEQLGFRPTVHSAQLIRRR